MQSSHEYILELKDPKIKAKEAEYRRVGNGEEVLVTIHAFGFTEWYEGAMGARCKTHWVCPDELRASVGVKPSKIFGQVPDLQPFIPETGDEFSYETKSGIAHFKVISFTKDVIEVLGYKMDVFVMKTDFLGYLTDKHREILAFIEKNQPVSLDTLRDKFEEKCPWTAMLKELESAGQIISRTCPIYSIK